MIDTLLQRFSSNLYCGIQKDEFLVQLKKLEYEGRKTFTWRSLAIAISAGPDIDWPESLLILPSDFSDDLKGSYITSIALFSYDRGRKV